LSIPIILSTVVTDSGEVVVVALVVMVESETSTAGGDEVWLLSICKIASL
jgi:hypothetical protein